MTKRRAWLTPDADEGAVTIVRPLFVPLPFLPMVAGALAELTNTWNWEQSGTVTPSGAAEAMSSMLFQWVDAGVGAMSLFRFTEECAFEFSNDNGETWQVVPGWNEYAATCFDSGPAITTTVLNEVDYDDPPSLNFNAETKTLALDLPTGLPPGVPIMTTEYNEGPFTGSQTYPALIYDPTNRSLGVSMPMPVVTGLRQSPDAFMTLQYLDRFGVWQNFADLAPAPLPPYTDPAVPQLTDEQKICLAANNAAEAMRATYVDVGNRLAGQLYDDPLDMMRELANSIIGLLAGDTYETLIDEAATILSFIAIQGEFAANPWFQTDHELLVPQLIANATIVEDGSVQFDHAAIMAWLSSVWTSQIPFIMRYGLMHDIVKFVGAEGLNRAGSVMYYTDPQAVGCGPTGWSYSWDFTLTDGGWIPQAGYGGVWESGAGWRASNDSGWWSIDIRLPITAAGTIEHVSMNHSGSNVQLSNGAYKLLTIPSYVNIVNNWQLAYQPGVHQFDVTFVTTPGAYLAVQIVQQSLALPQLTLLQLTLSGTGTDPLA